MLVQLGFAEFIMSLGLFILSLLVIRGIREGLYFFVSKVVNVDYQLLITTRSQETVSGNSLLYQMFVSFLDPVATWVSFALMIFVYFAYLQFTHNIYIQTLVLLLVIVLGFIFPFRLFIRFYSWIKNMGFKKDNRWWLLYWLVSLAYGLIAYYLVLFFMLFLNGGIILHVYGMLDTNMQTFMMQIYIQHVQAFLPMVFLSLMSYIVDMVVYLRNKNIEEENNQGLY